MFVRSVFCPDQTRLDRSSFKTSPVLRSVSCLHNRPFHCAGSLTSSLSRPAGLFRPVLTLVFCVVLRGVLLSDHFWIKVCFRKKKKKGCRSVLFLNFTLATPVESLFVCSCSWWTAASLFQGLLLVKTSLEFFCS